MAPARNPAVPRPRVWDCRRFGLSGLSSARLLGCALVCLLAGPRAVTSRAGDGAQPPTDQGPISSAADLTREDRALRAEQLRAAQQLYREFPRSDAVFVLGVVCSEQGDTDAAIRYWEEEIQLDPGAVRLHERAEALANLGDALKVKGEYDRAAAMLRESLRLNPRRAETHFRLAHLFYAQGKMEDCLRALDQGKVESAKGHALRGQACQRLDQLAEAKRSYEAALRLDPRLAEAYYGLAMTCTRLGETAQAEESRRQFAALKADHQVAGRRARAEFDPLVATRRSLAQTFTEIGWVYLAHGRSDRAEQVWLRAAEVDPDNTACRFQLVMLYQKTQRNQEALRFGQEMIRAEPANGFHHLGLGNLYARLKRPAEAEAAYKRALELAPDRAEGYFALAQFYLQANTNLVETVRLSRRAVELAPLAPHYYVLSQAQARNGDRSAARMAIQKACDLDPRTPQYDQWRKALERDK